MSGLYVAGLRDAGHGSSPAGWCLAAPQGSGAACWPRVCARGQGSWGDVGITRIVAFEVPMTLEQINTNDRVRIQRHEGFFFILFTLDSDTVARLLEQTQLD